MLTEKDKFEKILRIIKTTIRTYVIWNKNRRDIIPNGTFMFDENGEKIYIYCTGEKTERDYSNACAMLLHEFAHYLMYLSGEEENHRTEFDLEKYCWELAENITPQQYFPKNFYSLKNYCLEAYKS